MLAGRADNQVAGVEPAGLLRRFDRRLLRFVCFALTLLVASAHADVLVAADIEECRELFRAGEYQDCLTKTSQAVEERIYGEEWRVLKLQSEMALGKYAQAKATAEKSLESYKWSIQLRVLGHDALLHNGEEDAATALILEIDQLVAKQQWRYTDAGDLVTLGKMATLVGIDARQVLEAFYDPAKKNHPKAREPWIASGELALDKHDMVLAADTFRTANKKFGDDADIFFGLARALRSANPEQAMAAMAKTLELNPNHIEALLFQADQHIDSESYKSAHNFIDKALAVNPRYPKAWAYRAVLAHLDSDEKREVECRQEALSTWPKNPEVDYTIGRKLSQKYRFTEGAAYQQKALGFEKLYLPARIQLSQDLMRLGLEDKGWELAEATHKLDGYDTTTFNLLELKTKLDKFRTIENEHFVLRMDANEAAIYGERVMSLLERARTTLCEKYDLQLDEKITVEIFPDENDFAVRTFGMPAVSGFLGVCFGKVITANSPASQGDSPSNWESVLWHEFCHVVTLSKTENRMPRWLSEGISVYEEVQENPTWGQTMNPQYQSMILDGQLTPLAEMSSAFLSPESGAHLQFAYFQSSLIVEYIVKAHGIDALKQMLVDLKRGVTINDTLDRHTDGLELLEKQFKKFVDQKMADMAPEVDWDRPDLKLLKGEALADWVNEHPNNYFGLGAYARRLMEAEQYEAALKPLKKMAKLFPQYAGAGSPYSQLATIYRKLENRTAERKALEILTDQTSDEIAALRRLMRMQAEETDWPAALKTADRLLAVNPLLPEPHRMIAKAAEETDRPKDAIRAYRTLVAMKPNDPAIVHFRLATLLHEQGDPMSKRHVLKALEEAPRYRDAHRLLLEITRSNSDRETTKSIPPESERGSKADLPESSSSTPRKAATK